MRARPPARPICHVTTADRHSLVVLHGEIDLTNAADVTRVLLDEVERLPSGGTLAVDLAQVGFFAAAGAHVLLTVARYANDAGVVLTLGPMSPIVQLMLRLSHHGDTIDDLRVPRVAPPAQRADALTAGLPERDPVRFG